MESLVTKSCTEFTSLIASPAPVPGGGGASAMIGAIGIALGDMVGELTVGKKKYADVEADLRELMNKAQELRKRFLEMIDRDAEAFEPLSKAYGIPRDDPDRDVIMEKCLKEAAGAPLEIFDLSCQAIEIVKEFAEKGSRIVISDAATGICFLQAAMQGAAINVKVNTRLMKDREYADKINSHIEESMEKASAAAGEVYDNIYGSY